MACLRLGKRSGRGRIGSLRAARYECTVGEPTRSPNAARRRQTREKSFQQNVADSIDWNLETWSKTNVRIGSKVPFPSRLGDGPVLEANLPLPLPRKGSILVRLGPAILGAKI